jgi:hypothetical protein
MGQETSQRLGTVAGAAILFQRAYLGCAGLVLFGGIPILLLGMAYFGGGIGSALSSFRLGLRDSPLNWLFLLPLAFLPIYLIASKYAAGRRRLLALLLASGSSAFGVLLIAGHFEDKPVAERPSACHRGPYRLDDGRLMSVSLSPVAALNFDLSDGTRIMTWGEETEYSGTSCIGADHDKGGGFAMSASACPADQVNVHTHDRPPQIARRIPLTETKADFETGGLRFRARLFESPGPSGAPLIVLPARRDGVSRLDWGYTHYMLAGLGASVFIYDMQESWPYGYSEIRDDDDALAYASAAMAKLRSIVRDTSRPIGFYGDRDALLAAIRTDADFTIFESAVPPIRLLHQVSHPVLWFVPAKDAEVPARQLVEKLNAAKKNISLIVLPGADELGAWYRRQGEALCHINEPPQYWQLLSTWLSRRARSAAAVPGET